MVYKGFTALQSITLNIQSKVIEKLFLRGVQTNSISRYNILNQESVNNINQIYDLIKIFDDEETAKQMLGDAVKIVTKLALVFWNDLLSEDEENLFLKMIDAEKEVSEAFIAIHSTMQMSGKPDFTNLLTAMGVLQDRLGAMLATRFGAKTQERGRKITGYLINEKLYEFLFTDEAAQSYLQSARIMMEAVAMNHQIIVKFIVDRRSKSKRIKHIRKMSRQIQKEVFSKLETDTASELGTLRPSDEMIGERAMMILANLQKFIELESKDEKKAEELICNIVTIVAKMEAAFVANLFTDEDQQNLVEMIGVTRSLLDTFVKLGDQEDSSDISQLLEYYQQTEDLLCAILRPHFGGNTLSRVHSLFYYFKKPEVHVFFFKDMENEDLKKTLMTVFGNLYDEIPSTLLLNH